MKLHKSPNASHLLIKPRIAFFHSEGSVHYNPGLESIIAFLYEDGYDITYWHVETRELDSIGTHGYKTRKLNYFKRKALALCASAFMHRTVKRVLCRVVMGPSPHICVGVDRNGMIYASRYSSVTTTPKAFLSYEIYFRHEVGVDYKKDEIQACKHIVFAVCQDPERAKCLSEENSISLDRIINMPVSPCQASKTLQASAISKKDLGISQDYVAIFSGSFARWTMIDELLQIIEQWPANWALVLRGRARRDNLEELKKALSHPSIFISDVTNDATLFRQILGVADFGIAFYKSLDDAISTGSNIAKIGLSSGKISTYLAHSVPVICNHIGLYADLITEYNAGMVLNSPCHVPEFLLNLSSESIDGMKQGALRLFSEKIDANLYKQPISAAFSEAIAQKCDCD